MIIFTALLSASSWASETVDPPAQAPIEENTKNLIRATVILKTENGDPLARTTIDSKGSAQFFKLQPGKYSINSQIGEVLSVTPLVLSNISNVTVNLQNNVTTVSVVNSVASNPKAETAKLTPPSSAIAAKPKSPRAGDFMDIWVSTAFEDNNVFAGPDLYSPAANFVQRGNNTFFENYDLRVTDDISRANLVLYNESEGFHEDWSTETAFVLRYTPFLNPDMTQPGTNLRDDGSYVRLIRKLPGKDHEISLTGYAVDSGRFRMGYSYDLTWGARSMFSFDPGAVPGVRLQWQKGDAYAYAGAKSAIGDYITEDRQTRNQAYYGSLFGAGTYVTPDLKVEVGFGAFQQDQIRNVQSTDNPLYGEIINALGYCGQISWRSRNDMTFFQSADLRLMKNNAESQRDTYIRHRNLDGFGIMIQAEANVLQHNLLDPTQTESTTIETGVAGDIQAILVNNTTEVAMDLVYKDLPYILFNVPGLTSGVAMSPDMETSPQLYGRFSLSHHFPKIHVTPSVGIGIMQPATYKTEGGTFVQYTAYDKEQVPENQEPAAILSSVAGLQVDMSKSTVVVGEILYTIDNNLSDFVQSEDGLGGTRVAAPENERQALGFNLILRSRF